MRERVSTGERERDPRERERDPRRERKKDSGRERESERRNQGEKKREKGALPPWLPHTAPPLGALGLAAGQVAAPGGAGHRQRRRGRCPLN